MVFVFTEFKNQKMSLDEQQFIRVFFENLKYPNSYQSTLQYIYNNNKHFPESREHGFTLQDLSIFVNRLFSNEVFEIQGTIHDNYHKSDIVQDANTGESTFVKDYYIRIRDTKYNKIYHVIVDRPDVYVLHNLYPPFPMNFIIPPKFICKKNADFK